MKYLTIILLVSIVLFMVACNSSKKVNQTNSDVSSPIIKLAKSSCFGKCKVFNFKIYQDKTATYEGIKNVKNIGVFTSKITDKDYNALVSLFEDIDFNSLDSTYLTGVRDKQKTTLEYYQKEVKYQNRAASNELKMITKSIDDVIEKINWEKD